MTAINVDQELGLIVAPGSPSVAVDQALALLIERRLVPATIYNYIDQQLALLVVKRIIDLVQLVGGAYQDFLGNPLANGYLVLRLSHDGQSATPNQVVAGLTQRITLNSSGQISPAVAIYSNTGLLPANSFYLVRVYAADGTEVVPLSKITIPNTPTPVNLATLTWSSAA